MANAFWDTIGQLYQAIVPTICQATAFARPPQGLSSWQFAVARAGVFVIFFIPVYGSWRASEKRLYANGFAKPMLNWGLALITLAIAVPILEALAVPVIGPVAACPYDWIALAVMTILVLAGLYCFQLGRRYNDSKVKRGGFRRFTTIVAGPLLAVVALNSPRAGVASAGFLVWCVEVVARLAGRVHAGARF